MPSDGSAGGSVSSSSRFSTLLHGYSGHPVTSLAVNFLCLSKVLSGVGVHASGGLYSRSIVTALMQSEWQCTIFAAGRRRYLSRDASTDEIDRPTNQWNAIQAS